VIITALWVSGHWPTKSISTFCGKLWSVARLLLRFATLLSFSISTHCKCLSPSIICSISYGFALPASGTAIACIPAFYPTSDTSLKLNHLITSQVWSRVTTSPHSWLFTYYLPTIIMFTALCYASLILSSHWTLHILFGPKHSYKTCSLCQLTKVRTIFYIEVLLISLTTALAR